MRSRRLKSAVAVLLLCALCFLTVSCGERQYVRVSFQGARTELAELTAEKGQPVTLPRDLDPQGFYSFGGWFADAACEDGPIDVLKPIDDTIVYAKWIPIEFTLTYALNGGTYDRAHEVFTCQAPIVPGSPTKPGYTFDGWFFDPDLTKPIISTEGINYDLTVYARWKALPPAPYLKFSQLPDGSYAAGMKAGLTAPEHVVIPAEYNGAAVTAVDEAAFENQTSLRSVTLYENVTAIGDNAFAGTPLESIDLTGVRSIGKRAFAGCELGSAWLESVETVDDYAFVDCAALQYAVLGRACASVTQSAFSGCGLRSVVCLSDEPPSLDVSAFGEPDEPFHIYVPDASMARYEAEPGWKKYYSLDRLHAVSVIEGDYAVASEPSEAGVRYKLLQYFGGETADVPEHVDEIGNYAFAHSEVRDVTLYDVTRIGQYAFAGCSLRTLTVNASAPPVLGAYAVTPAAGLKIRVPARLEQAYRTAESWSAFTDYLVFFDGRDPA